MPHGRSALRAKVAAACRKFLERAPPEESTLTLDGTGVNGHIQFVILRALGLDVIKRLHRVNLISGSAYTYCAFLAGEEGLVPDMAESMRRWDAENRRSWHEVSIWRMVSRAGAIVRGTGALYSNECLEKMMRGTVSAPFASRRVADLPPNVTFWLHSLKDDHPLAVSQDSPFGETTVAHLGRCCAAIPRLYEPARLGSHVVIDPVFSPSYAALKKKLRSEARNHLVGNVGLDHETPDTIWIKPHEFGSARRVVLEDFTRMIFNIPNSRIYESYLVGYGAHEEL